MPLWKFKVMSLQDRCIKIIKSNIAKISLDQGPVCRHESWNWYLEESVTGSKGNSVGRRCKLCKEMKPNFHLGLKEKRLNIENFCECDYSNYTNLLKPCLLSRLELFKHCPLNIPTLLSPQFINKDYPVNEDYPKFIFYQFMLTSGIEDFDFSVDDLNGRPAKRQLLCACLPKAVLELLAQRCQSLKNLVVSGVEFYMFKKLALNLFDAFSNFKHLTSLDISLTPLEDEDYVPVEAADQDNLCLEIAKSLKCLSRLEFCDYLGTAKGIGYIIKGCKLLEEIEFPYAFESFYDAELIFETALIKEVVLKLDNLRQLESTGFHLERVLLDEIDSIKHQKPNGLNIERVTCFNKSEVNVISLCPKLKYFRIHSCSNFFQDLYEYDFTFLEELKIEMSQDVLPYPCTIYKDIIPLIKNARNLTDISIEACVTDLDLSSLLYNLPNLEIVFIYINCNTCQAENFNLPCNFVKKLDFSKPFWISDLSIHISWQSLYSMEIKHPEESLVQMLGNMPHVKNLCIKTSLTLDGAYKLIAKNRFSKLERLSVKMPLSATLCFLEMDNPLRSLSCTKDDLDPLLKLISEKHLDISVDSY